MKVSPKRHSDRRLAEEAGELPRLPSRAGLLLELAVWIQSFTSRRPWRRRKPMRVEPVYVLMAVIGCLELAVALRILGLVRPLG